MKKLIYDNKDAKRIFFTSDTHFGHINIIKYCNRPFETIEEHDEEIIKRWNNKVKEDDIVFHLGDVGFCHPKKIHEYLERLNGHIYLVIGNHDWRSIIKQQSWRFEDMTQQINMKIDGQHIILNHYPLLCYSGVYQSTPSWQLYGHVHSGPFSNQGLDNSRLTMCYSTQYDVGVDNNDFSPVSFLELKDIIDKRIKEYKLNKSYEQFRLGKITIGELNKIKKCLEI